MYNIFIFVHFFDGKHIKKNNWSGSEFLIHRFFWTIYGLYAQLYLMFIEIMFYIFQMYFLYGDETKVKFIGLLTSAVKFVNTFFENVVFLGLN